MVELSKFQIASIKRTNASVRPILRKINTLEKKIEDMQSEILELSKLVDSWEMPVMSITGGLTSSEYLDILNGVKTQEEAVNDLPEGNLATPAEYYNENN